MKRESTSFRNGLDFSRYVSKVFPGHISGRSSKNGNTKIGCKQPWRVVFKKSGILIVALEGNISMFLILILDRVCTLCAVKRAIRVISFFERFSKDNVSLG